MQLSKSRSILVGRNLTVESAENVLNNQFVYELSMNSCIMYFIPDTDKVSPSYQLHSSLAWSLVK